MSPKPTNPTNPTNPKTPTNPKIPTNPTTPKTPANSKKRPKRPARDTVPERRDVTPGRVDAPRVVPPAAPLTEEPDRQDVYDRSVTEFEMDGVRDAEGRTGESVRPWRRPRGHSSGRP